MNEDEVESSLILKEVLDRANQGDSAAERILHEKYSQRLVHLASSRIAKIFNSKIDPQDIVQSVFCSFFVRARNETVSFRDWNELWSFLFTVTVRKCSEQANRFLRDKRNVNREAFQNQLAERSEGFGLASSEPTPYQVSEFEETLANLMEPLTDTQRDIVRMRLDGCTNAEISKTLKRTERTGSDSDVLYRRGTRQ